MLTPAKTLEDYWNSYINAKNEWINSSQKNDYELYREALSTYLNKADEIYKQFKCVFSNHNLKAFKERNGVWEKC